MTDIVEEYMDNVVEEVSTKKKLKSTKKKDVDTKKKDVDTKEIEEKRESLCILAVLGTTYEYTGMKLSLVDVKRLSIKDVEKYYNRYQVVMGNKVTNGLVDTALQGASQMISYVCPIDDKEALCHDLQNDDLVKKELTEYAGYAVLKGGRMVALASALIQIGKHIKFTNNTLEQPTDPLEQS